MSKDQLLSVLKGAAIAAIGAGLTALQTGLADLPIGPVLTPALTAINSVAVNLLRKWLFG